MRSRRTRCSTPPPSCASSSATPARTSDEVIMDKHDVTPQGLPIGRALPGWQAPPVPPRTPMAGRFCSLEALDPARHAADLHAANSLDRDGRNWTYLTVGPFATEGAYREWTEKVAPGADPLFHAIIDA